MSHTLHRSGSEESLKNDFVILTMGAQGYNRDGCAKKQVKIAEIFLKHNAINCGILGLEGELTSDRLQEALETIPDSAVTHGVFNNERDLTECLTELKAADLGLSIVVSGLFDRVHECCREAGIKPHTVNTSMGIWGNVAEKLPADERIRDISSMCGHGMLPFTLVEDWVKKIKSGRVTPVEAADKLNFQCHCHIFNRERAARIFAELASEH